MSREAEVRVRVQLGNNQIPERIQWSATDAPFSGEKDCQALILSIWDSTDADTLSIELWTEGLTTDEMGFFVLQTLMKLAETLKQATGRDDLSALIHDCSNDLAAELKEGVEGT